MIFIIKGFRIIVFIFIVISTNFRPIFPLLLFPQLFGLIRCGYNNKDEDNGPKTLMIKNF